MADSITGSVSVCSVRSRRDDSDATVRTQKMSITSTRLSTEHVRKISKLAFTNGPDRPSLVDIDIESLNTRDDQSTTIGGMAAKIDRNKIDKEIKTEVAHHSRVMEDDAGSSEDADSISEGRLPEDSIISLILRHLHVALASPVLFRVPYLVYKHSNKSGSAFLLVYFILLIAVAIPLAFLETVMAQYSSLGPINIYRCLPMFSGVGIGMLFLCILLLVYMGPILCWSLIYTIDSLVQPFPWEECPPNSSPVCENVTQNVIVGNVSTLNAMLRKPDCVVNQKAIILMNYIPSEYYFLTKVTHSLGNEEVTKFDLELTLLIVAVWIVLFGVICWRRKWKYSKVTYWTAAIFFIFLFAMIIEGITMEQSDRGFHRAFALNLTNVDHEISNPTVWMDALGQIFWSIGIATGLNIMNNSHNRFRDSINTNVLTALIVNFILTIVIMLAVFPFFGELFQSPQISSNIGFFFVLSSYAITNFQLSHFYSFLFYLLLVIHIFANMVTLGDTILESVAEISKLKWRTGLRRAILGALICTVALLLSLCLITTDGLYIMTALDAYLPWISAALFGLIETIAFTYFYGIEKVLSHLHKMNLTKVKFGSYCQYILPLILLTLQLWAWIVGVNDPLNYEHTCTGREGIHQGVALLLSLTPVLALLIGTIYIVVIYKQKNRSLMKSQSSWGPASHQHKLLYTRDILRATQRIPWLVVQTKGDLLAESKDDDWIPYGFSYLPRDSSYVLLSASTWDDEMEDSSRLKIIKNYYNKFGPDGTFSKEVEEPKGCAECRRKELKKSEPKRKRAMSFNTPLNIEKEQESYLTKRKFPRSKTSTCSSDLD